MRKRTVAGLRWFAGRRIWAEGRGVEADRLGSVRGATGTPATGYYPYGEERVTTEQNRTKFATYYRDETTALDYADQRYYHRLIGRFLTADPYLAPDAVRNPTEWNRYAYVAGDPVNFYDPQGLQTSETAPVLRCSIFGFPAWGELCEFFLSKAFTQTQEAGSARRKPLDTSEWEQLSEECRRGLETAMRKRPSPSEESAIALRLQALGRAREARSWLEAAASGSGID